MSDSVLAQLKVVLSANISKLKSGLDEATIQNDKFAKKTEYGFHRIGQVIERLVGPLSATGRKIALGFDALGESAAEAGKGLSGVAGGLGLISGIGAAGLAGVGAGLFALANKAAEAGAQIYDASEKTGIAASEISGIKALAMETGEDFDGLTQALSRFGVNLTNALIDPTTIGARELKQLLGGAKGLNELGLKPMGERLQIVLQKIFSLNDVAQQHAMMQALLGRGWMQNVDTLKVLAKDGYAPAIEQARKFGVFFDESSARQAKDFTEKVKTLKSEISGLAVEMGTSLLPAFNNWMVGLVGLAAAIQNVGHAINIAMSAITKPGESVPGQFVSVTQAETDFLTKIDELTRGAAQGGSHINDVSGGRGGHGGRGGNRVITYLTNLREQLGELLHGKAAAGIEKLKELGATQVQIGQGRQLMDAIQSLKEEQKFAEEFGKAQTSMQKMLEKLSVPKATEETWRTLGDAIERVNASLIKAGSESLGIKSATRISMQDQAMAASFAGGPLGGFTPGFTPSGFGKMRFDFDKLNASAKEFGKTVSSSFTRMIETGQGFHQMLGDLLREFETFALKASVFKMLGSSLSGSGGFLGTIGSFFSGMALPGRASGGPVTAGQLYMVDEQGPELFAPAISGSIISGGGLSGGGRGGNTYNIDARGSEPGMEHRIARAIQAMQKQSVGRSLAATYEYKARGGAL